MTPFKGRLEDRRMLTGRGTYAADWNLPGQACAHMLRSDRPHAEIVSIDASAALALDGVLCVLTGDDTAAAGFKSLPSSPPIPGRNGMKLRKPHRPVLAQGRVNYVGEPVAMVVAETAELAQDASELITIVYRDLPYVHDAQAATRPAAQQLHEAVPDNVVLEHEVGDAASIAARFEGAARVVELTVRNTRVIGSPMEPRACLAHYEPGTGPDDGHYVLHAPTQGARGSVAQLSTVLDVPAERISVIAREVGGSFGVRGMVYHEYCAALLASKKIGRPVKWVGTRSECFVSDSHGRDVLAKGEVALDASGRMLAMRFGFLTNLGAYLCPTVPRANTFGVNLCISGVYDVPATGSRTTLAVSNNAPLANYRGAGRPVMSYILERLADQAAHELGLDPAEYRRRNLVPVDRFPYRIASGAQYDCGNFEAVLDGGIEASGWRSFEARKQASAARGLLRGRGLSLVVEASGGDPGSYDEVDIRFTPDGSITLHATTQNQGQGHETAFAQIVAGVLGVPMEGISLHTGERGEKLHGGGAGGSRTLVWIGSGMRGAAFKVIEQGKVLAARELEVSATDLEFSEGSYRVSGTDRVVRLDALARKYSASVPHPLDARFESRMQATYPNGCHIAEVEIEPDTGVAEIVSYVACDDAGNIINHQMVEGQVQGGVTQGAGQVLLEHAVYDPETGQLLSGSYMDYAMPRAGLVGGLKLIEQPCPTRTNPLGAKGVGESGVTGSLPAVMNAVMDALRGAGVTHFDMPASPERVWRAICEARRGNPRALGTSSFAGQY